MKKMFEMLQNYLIHFLKLKEDRIVYEKYI